MLALIHLQERRDVSNSCHNYMKLLINNAMCVEFGCFCECIYTFCFEQSVTELAALLLLLQLGEEEGFKPRLLVAPHLTIHFRGGAERRSREGGLIKVMTKRVFLKV